RYGLAHHMGSHSPGSVFRIEQLSFQLGADPRTIRFNGPAATEAGRISSEKICLLLMQVPEPRNIAAVGPSPGRGIFQQALIFPGNACAIVMEGDIFTQQAVVIAESFGKAVGG